MIGTVVNTAAIIVGSVAGSVFKKGLKEAYQDILMQAMGLAAAALGINAMPSLSTYRIVNTLYYLLSAWLLGV